MSRKPVLALLVSLPLMLAPQEKSQSSEPTGSSGQIIQFQGPIPNVHDPVMAKEDGRYYLFCTGRGVAAWTSPDMKTWKREEGLFPQGVSWTSSTIPGSRTHYWAPDISYFNGKWHLYYSVSTFGSNRSAIGLVTTPTLDRTKPNYGWKDEGVVVQSYKADNYNAIDANVVLDENGTPWLSYGSFWGGIKLIELDVKTGKPVAYAPLHSIARRPNDAVSPGAIEGPFIIRHGGYYYQFVSFDFCCKGVNSTYNIRVGRSKDVMGPYVDRDGKSLMEGGGTLVLEGAGRWKGPGHNSIFREGERDWLVYHAYDAESNGMSKLRIEELQWDAAGWPVAASARASSVGIPLQ